MFLQHYISQKQWPQAVPMAEFLPYFPVKPPMMLLAMVVATTETSIICTATSHGDLAHPLRIDDTLSMVHTIEYAAQAVAAHMIIAHLLSLPLAELQTLSLLPPAFLSALRDCELAPGYLDDYAACELRMEGHQLMTIPNAAQYRVTVCTGEATLCTAIMTVAR